MPRAGTKRTIAPLLRSIDEALAIFDTTDNQSYLHRLLTVAQYRRIAVPLGVSWWLPGTYATGSMCTQVQQVLADMHDEVSPDYSSTEIRELQNCGICGAAARRVHDARIMGGARRVLYCSGAAARTAYGMLQSLRRQYTAEACGTWHISQVLTRRLTVNATLFWRYLVAAEECLHAALQRVSTLEPVPLTMLMPAPVESLSWPNFYACDAAAVMQIHGMLQQLADVELRASSILRGQAPVFYTRNGAACTQAVLYTLWRRIHTLRQTLGQYVAPLVDIRQVNEHALNSVLIGALYLLPVTEQTAFNRRVSSEFLDEHPYPLRYILTPNAAPVPEELNTTPTHVRRLHGAERT